MKKVMLLLDSPGAADFIAPVIPLLRKRFLLPIVTVNTSTSAPFAMLKKFRPLRCDQEKNVETLYRKIKPDAVLAGTSSLALGPFVNNRFLRLAHADKKPVIAFQDYWGNHRFSQNQEAMNFWNLVLAPDALAQKLLQSDGFKGTIEITGNPALDKLASLDKKEMRAKLRKKLNIKEEEFVILYAGTGTPQSWHADETTFQFLATALQEFLVNHPDTIVIPRRHPRDEEKNRYQKLAPRLPLYNPDYKSKIYSTDDLLPMADCVISMYSTALLHACILNIPSISILLHEAGRARLRELRLDNFPPNTVGACCGIYKESTKELFAALNAVRSDPVFCEKMIRAQTQFFSQKTEKPATHLVAETISSFLARL